MSNLIDRLSVTFRLRGPRTSGGCRTWSPVVEREGPTHDAIRRYYPAKRWIVLIPDK